MHVLVGRRLGAYDMRRAYTRTPNDGRKRETIGDRERRPKLNMNDDMVFNFIGIFVATRAT